MSTRTVAPCPKHWIEISLIDPDDKPVPNEEYTVRLPDGKEVRGYLDENGFTRLDHIPAGQCQVQFPRISRDDWQPAGTRPEKGSASSSR